MPDRAEVPAARALLSEAIGRQLFPAAVAEVGDAGGVIWREAFGHLSSDEGAPAVGVGTLFDLASLTKPLATTALALDLVARGLLALDERVADCLPDWRGERRDRVTLRDLLEHASGLSARLVDRPPHGRREFEHEICALPLEYEPRTSAVYSDLGFILLGFIVEDRGASSLADQFAGLLARVTRAAPGIMFAPGASPVEGVAPTRPVEADPRRGRVLSGEVHDDYAAALGGAAGHAGLFGTAAGVGGLARLVLAGARGIPSPAPFSPAMVRLATRRSEVPDSSRALGWDTMLPTSSCGTKLSPAAFGHVGFTGTSLWVDPARDRYYVLLTNRVMGRATLDDMRTVRRAFHDLLAAV